MSDTETTSPEGGPESGAPDGDSESGAPDGATENRTAPGAQEAPMERSSAERAPPALLEAADAAMAGGATVEQIAALVRSGDCAGRMAIESLRRMAFSALAELGRREGPVPVDDLDSLAQVLRRIESIDRLRQARERAKAKPAPGAGQAPARRDLSDEAAAAIRAFAEGRLRRAPATPAPVDPRKLH